MYSYCLVQCNMKDWFAEMKKRGERIAALTCYDASFAHAMEQAGIDLLLVGDSLGMVVQGEKDTTGVSLLDIEYHTRCVSKAALSSFVAADMPLGSFHESDGRTLENARRLLYAGAGMVKIEGGKDIAARIAFVADGGIPVCGHIGLLPQSHAAGAGGMRKGVDDVGISRLVEDARAIEDAGASLLVLEMVSVEGAEAVAKETGIPTIGIGSGNRCDGQVLVMHDMLGMVLAGRERPLRFVNDFLCDSRGVVDAFRAYRDAVKSGAFPSESHSFSRKT